MPEKVIILKLETVLDHVKVIQEYFASIKTVDDFYTKKGTLIEDAILMRLQVVGENIKKINKKDPSLFAILGEDLSPIIRFRDLLSHHYEKVNPQIIFEICSENIPRLKQQIEELLNLYK